MLRKLGLRAIRLPIQRSTAALTRRCIFIPPNIMLRWVAYFVAKGLQPHPFLQAAGAFGENISASGLAEDKVRIGDRFRLGKALVEVAQGRQPCWKIDHHFGVHGMTAAVIETGRCGLYFRVMEEGLVAPMDRIEQVEQSGHDWTVERTFRLLIGGGHKADSGGLKELAAMETLAESWRSRAAKLAG